MFMTGCAARPTLDLYDGPQRGDKFVATIVIEGQCWDCVKLIRLAAAQSPIYKSLLREYTPEVPGKFRVPPGRYELDLYGWLKTRKYAARWRGYVDLKSGYTYHVDIGRSWPSYRTYLWMEEAVTGEVLLGSRVPQNDVEYAELYRVWAHRGSTHYQWKMGILYEEGRVLPQNYVLAYMWYSLTLKRLEIGDRRDQVAAKMTIAQRAEAVVHRERRLEIGERRDQVAAKMTIEQIAEAQRLVGQWKPNQLVLDEKMTPEQTAEAQRLLRQWKPEPWKPEYPPPPKNNSEIIEEYRLKLEAQCAAQPERC